MGETNFRQVFAKKYKNEKIIKALCPKADNSSGIYLFYRQDEAGFKYAYIGQATKSLLSRMAQHLSGYQHIDLSIRNHGLYSAKNPYGYKAQIVCHCSPEKCDELEMFYVKEMANRGYQMRNTTGGSQGIGKFNINNNKPSKGYYDGLKRGYYNAQKEVSKLFEKNLTYSISGKPNKFKEKALAKFEQFLKIEDIENSNENGSNLNENEEIE